LHPPQEGKEIARQFGLAEPHFHLPQKPLPGRRDPQITL
jgi:hypothetical protein